MNPLSNFLNFFRKKPSVSTEADDKWLQGYDALVAGKKHLAEGRHQAALDYFDTAVECGFDDGEMFGSRAPCLQSLEWHLDAIDDFTKAIRREPEDSNLYFQRSISKRAVGDQQGGLADMQDAIRIAKTDNKFTRGYNLVIKDMGWQSVVAMYEGFGAIWCQTPDTIIERRIKETKLRGRRKDNKEFSPKH
ncbi:MAG TPA: hypothetical protein VGH42_03400 [Verrucomicrobiae bacterium]|jgi:tetratricopeptide (TPR) repeat protein